MEITLAIAFVAVLLTVWGLLFSSKRTQPLAWNKEMELFRNVRRILREERFVLAQHAHRIQNERQVAGAPLIAKETWIPFEPVPLSTLVVTEGNASDPTAELLTSLRHLWPRSGAGTRYTTYSETIEALDKPELFYNGDSYRALSINVKDIKTLRIEVRGANFNLAGHAMLANAHVSQ